MLPLAPGFESSRNGSLHRDNWTHNTQRLIAQRQLDTHNTQRLIAQRQLDTHNTQRLIAQRQLDTQHATAHCTETTGHTHNIWQQHLQLTESSFQLYLHQLNIHLNDLFQFSSMSRDSRIHNSRSTWCTIPCSHRIECRRALGSTGMRRVHTSWSWSQNSDEPASWVHRRYKRTTTVGSPSLQTDNN